MGPILGANIDPKSEVNLIKIGLVFDLVVGWSQDGSKTVPRALLGGSWVVLGGVLGRSWGLLGPLETLLTTILRPTNRKIENKTVQVQFE